MQQAPTLTSAIQTSKEQPAIMVLDGLIILLSVSCLVFSVWAASAGWHNTIFNNYSFRQTQTAMTTEYLKSGGSFLRYETPVLGPPWRVPFELPLYQYLVALVSSIFRYPIDQTGRLVSLVFFYATLVPSFVVLRHIGIRRRIHRLPALALFAISPHYIFWSRSFMIESTALFFSVVYLASLLDEIRADDPHHLLGWTLAALTATSGALAGMVKVTTFVPFLILGVCLVLRSAWSNGRLQIWRKTLWVSLSTAGVFPFVLTYIWTTYCDRVKGGYPIGAFLTSSGLRAFVIGTLKQRFAWHSYAAFGGSIGFVHTIDNVIGNRIVLLAAVILLAVAARRYFKVALVSFVLYLLPIALFFNLYFFHAYYICANGIFLIAIVGLAIAGGLEAGGWKRWAAVYLFAFAVAASATHFFYEFHEAQRSNIPGRPAAAAMIADETNASDVLVIYGLDWSPEFPYQAHRRAIMGWRYVQDRNLLASIQTVGANHVGALLICEDERKNSPGILAGLRSVGFSTVDQAVVDDCDVYFQHPRHIH